MARPRKYTEDQPAPSGAARVRASRERRVAAGQREIRAWLSAEQASALDAFAADQGVAAPEAIGLLIDRLTKG